MGLHDDPTAAQLVAVVRDFLAGDVLPAVEGRLLHHTRIAIHALTMVECELTAGRSARATEHERRLVALGLPDDAALADAIRAGELDGPEVAELVQQAVRAKLEVIDLGRLD